ncbi:MAG: translation elongation factor Ts [Patescibacteria group bacterium]
MKGVFKMSITPSMVSDLRKTSGAGMMDCKRALGEANGDMTKAQEILRKWGMASVTKRAGRTAAEGTIGYTSNDDNTVGVLVEVNCETDFVAKNDDFKAFVKNVTKLIKENNFDNLDSLLNSKLNEETVESRLQLLTAKIGEKLSVRRFAKDKADSTQKLAQYIHPGDKIGVMILYSDPSGKLDEMNARDVAMHVAAMRPQYLRSTDISQDVMEKEKEIVAAQMKDEKKPPEIIEKILEGKLRRYFSEVCLEDQLFVKDPDGKATVAKWLTKIDQGIKIEKFVRFEVGEGL